jgi:type IV secretory pathway VirB4 component
MKPSNTQKHLLFKSIKDGVVVMRDGSLRAVLMVNSINFNLESHDEQTALLQSYQNFLNSLTFPIQIVVQSRTLDLDDYLKKLEAVSKVQNNELLQTQTEEYITFVRELIGIANIMSKNFYVVIPYTQGIQEKGGLIARLFRRATNAVSSMTKAEEEILRRANLISGTLGSLRLSSVLLNTEELIDLFYTTYNPDVAQRQKLFNVSNVDIDIITAASKERKEPGNAVV